MKPLVALLLALCLTAQADPADRARGSAGADIATTGIGLALGAIEANPAGLLTLPLKLVALDYAAKLPEGERQQAQITLGAVWTGATVNNVCVIVAIATVVKGAARIIWGSGRAYPSTNTGDV